MGSSFYILIWFTFLEVVKVEKAEKHSPLPTGLSVIKLFLVIPIIYYAANVRLEEVVIWSLVAIFLDYLDGLLAGWLGSIRWGDLIDALTDMWQYGLFVGLWQGDILPWWYVLIVIPTIGALSFIAISVADASWARLTLRANSITAMVISFCLIGNQLLGNVGVGVVLLMAVIMGVASWDIIKANQKGEPVHH